MCVCVCASEGMRWRESTRYSQSRHVDGASRGSCVLRDHYCNEGNMAATLAGPQAAQYNWSSAVWITLIKAFLHSTTILSKSTEITVTYLRRTDPKKKKKKRVVSNCPAVSTRSSKTCWSKQAVTHSPRDKMNQIPSMKIGQLILVHIGSCTQWKDICICTMCDLGICCFSFREIGFLLIQRYYLESIDNPANTKSAYLKFRWEWK